MSTTLTCPLRTNLSGRRHGPSKSSKGSPHTWQQLSRAVTRISKTLTTSFRAAWANLGGMLGLMGLLFLISLVASACCYLPALFVMPFNLGALALAYRKVFPE